MALNRWLLSQKSAGSPDCGEGKQVLKATPFGMTKDSGVYKALRYAFSSLNRGGAIEG